MENSSFYKENKINRTRRTVLTAVILLVFFLQNTEHLFPRPWGVTAMLLAPLVICIGMFERETSGMVFGAAAGALLAAFSTQTVCYHTIMLAAAGYFSGLLVTRLIRNNLNSCFLMNVVFLFVYNSLYYLLFYYSPAQENSQYVYFNMYMASGLYTAFFIPLFYVIVRAVSKKYRVE